MEREVSFHTVLGFASGVIKCARSSVGGRCAKGDLGSEVGMRQSSAEARLKPLRASPALHFVFLPQTVVRSRR